MKTVYNAQNINYCVLLMLEEINYRKHGIMLFSVASCRYGNSAV
jgi:hypothetical protein